MFIFPRYVAKQKGFNSPRLHQRQIPDILYKLRSIGDFLCFEVQLFGIVAHEFIPEMYYFEQEYDTKYDTKIPRP